MEKTVEPCDENVWATVGLHPHDADGGYEALEEIARLAEFEKVVGIGECGLDNFRSETTPEDQERALRFQIELGLDRDLAMVFHVRDARQALRSDHQRVAGDAVTDELGRGDDAVNEA